MDCRGEGDFTVVFESGLGPYGSVAWSSVHDRVAEFACACTYNRGVILWSDPSGQRRTPDAIATDLHAALEQAGKTGPTVIVGHSIGGLYAVAYATQFPEGVAGVVLVDSSHPDQNTRFAEIGFPAPSVTPAQSMSARLAWTGLPRTGNGTFFAPPRPSEDAPLEVKRTYDFAPTTSVAMVQELMALDETFSAIGERHDLGSTPLYVLDAARFPTDQERRAQNVSLEVARKFQEVSAEMQRDFMTWSTRSTFEELTDSVHCVQCDRPDAIVAAVRAVIETARTN